MVPSDEDTITAGCGILYEPLRLFHLNRTFVSFLDVWMNKFCGAIHLLELMRKNN